MRPGNYFDKKKTERENFSKENRKKEINIDWG